jgi:ribonuclease E
LAESTSVAASAALPAPEQIAQAERFTRELFVHPGESPADALGPGTPRRRALDRALREVEDGLTVPSTKWRRRYSLMLGLERVLSEEEVVLADGTPLNPHQVDALSGTLTALLTREQGNGSAVAPSTGAPVLAVDETTAYAPVPDALRPVAREAQDEEPEEEEPDDVELDDDDDEDDEDDRIVAAAAPDEDDDEDDEPEPVVEDPGAEEAAEAEDEADSYEDDVDEDDVDEDIDDGAVDDPNAGKRFWFEHATGAGKTVAAMGFVEASRTGGVLILTHRRNLVDQFNDELTTRGYGDRISPALLGAEHNLRADGPVTVETYQWFVRNAGQISAVYTVVICDEAHTALGEKTSAAIREWTGPIFVGMTATGALIARHVTDLFPTQTSRFDLAQAARRGVIAPLRGIRIPPGVGVRSIAKVPLRRGEVDVEFDQELLAELLDQQPFNMAIADLYKARFNGVPGVLYAAGVKHAYNVAEALRDAGIKAQAVSGETPKRVLAESLAAYERGDIDVLVNAQLLAEGWNSPRATVCMHLAPTASKRIYQQRVGRVTRRHLGKEAGVVVDFVHPATKNDDPVITLHSLLDRDVYRGGAIVVGPVRRGRGRRVRVERRVVPVCAEEDRRHEVFERELWRIAVEFLDWGEQHMWAALAGARVTPSGWRRARAMLQFDKSGELKSRFLLTALERNKNTQLRVRALQEIAAGKDADAFQQAVDVVAGWPRTERSEGVKVLLLALAERRIGRRDQANQWIWDLADMTRDIHEEYAVQRWPETKRLLGLLVNSSGGAHARNARRLVHASRKQDRRLSAAILAAAVAHTPEAMEVVRGARTRMARKPSSLSRELLRNFPKARGRRSRRRKKGAGSGDESPPVLVAAGARDPAATEALRAAQNAEAASREAQEREQLARAEQSAGDKARAAGATDAEVLEAIAGAAAALAQAVGEAPTGRSRRARARRSRRTAAAAAAATAAANGAAGASEEPQAADGGADASGPASADGTPEPASPEPEATAKPKPKRASRAKAKPAAPEATPEAAEAQTAAAAPTSAEPADAAPPAKPKRAPRAAKKPAAEVAAELEVVPDAATKPKRAPRPRKVPAAKVADALEVVAVDAGDEPKPKPKRASRAKAKPKAAPVEDDAA